MSGSAALSEAPHTSGLSPPRGPRADTLHPGKYSVPRSCQSWGHRVGQPSEPTLVRKIVTSPIPEPSGPPTIESLDQTQPRVIVVGALKGGTGKTRLAMLIALFLAVILGRRVVVFDADSASQTASKWPEKAQMRGYARWPFEIIRFPFAELDKEIDKVRARGNVDDIVVDVGGGQIDCFLAAVRRVNILLVPLCPDEGDTEQAPQTRQAVLMGAALNNTGKPLSMNFVLSRCENSNDRVDARERLLNSDQEGGAYPLLDTEIPDLVAYKRTYGRIPGPATIWEDKATTASDKDRPRWKDLVNFIPLLVESDIITREEALGTGLIIERQLEKVSL
ncbi:ParA family protein [Streptomyces sp. NPDC001584]|uniref:ParA family protein n=1 Tax=Streptomyces sp. NPDC001584 TaxID=3154521 RepID=UPI00333238F3